MELLIMRLLALGMISLGIYAVIRWDMQGNDIISGASLLAALLLAAAGVVWGMIGLRLDLRPYFTLVGYMAFGIGVFKFFYARRKWKDVNGLK